MWTQFERLTTPRAWRTQAMQVHSALNLEDHHVVSQAWPQLSESNPEASSTKDLSMCVALAAKTDPNRHTPLCPQLRALRRPLPYSAFGAWSILGPNFNLNQRRNGTPRKRKPTSKPNRALGPPRSMDPHFSPRGTSGDWSRLGTGDVPGPNPNPG